MNFPIIIEKDEYGYVAKCPSLDGCFVQGKTYEEVIANMKDAVTLHIEDRIAMNQEIPNNISINLTSIYVNVLGKGATKHQGLQLQK